MNEPLISLKNVSFSYDSEVAVDAIHNVSVDIKSGEYVSVIGHNGSGKSTFAKLLNLVLTPTSGAMTIAGVEVLPDSVTTNDLIEVRRHIGMVFQNPDNQLVATVVEEDVAFGPENLGLSREEIRKRVDQSLEKVEMTAYLKSAPHKLSGGQKQRVAIAGVLAMRPLCMIFDESTAMLDPKGRKDVLRTMEELNANEGITVIHITHHMSEAVRANRTLVFDGGEIVMDGSPKEVFRNITKIRALGLEVPQGADVIDRLRKAGYPIAGDCLTANECADALYSLLKGGKEQ
ncbi:MAG: energy-coupling factor transporter ATPase [Clostridia bacterium]|nr:energy-coupling factor transporter ATPase [Clostridia bacterium]